MRWILFPPHMAAQGRGARKARRGSSPPSPRGRRGAPMGSFAAARPTPACACRAGWRGEIGVALSETTTPAVVFWFSPLAHLPTVSPLGNAGGQLDLSLRRRTGRDDDEGREDGEEGPLDVEHHPCPFSSPLSPSDLRIMCHSNS